MRLRTLSKALLILGTLILSTIAFASLEDCLNLKNIEGSEPSYKEIINYCEPYAEKDYYATAALAGAYIDINETKTVKYFDWVIDYYKKNHLSNTDDTATYADANLILGDIYYFGSKHVAEGEKPIPADPKKGLEYYTKSANLGNNFAQYQLGEFYNTSKGGLPGLNVATSYKWYTLAVANGSERAREVPMIRRADLAVKQIPYCLAMGEQLVAQAYIDGTAGLSKDNSKAKDYLTKAIALYKDNKPTKENLKYCPEGADKLNLESAEKELDSL